jgi:predicted DNA-binding transcriptional regulator AlpA
MDRPERSAETAGTGADRKSTLPLLLRAAGAAALCSTSVRTWRMWNVLGKIPQPIHIGRTPLWRYQELLAWVAAGCPDRVTWEALRE